MAKLGKKERTPSIEQEKLQIIITALDGLSVQDKQRLMAYARSRHSRMKARIFHADAEDLLHEAIRRTLEGRRDWNPAETDIVHFLIGCMRSITSQFFDSERRDFEYRNSLLNDPIESPANTRSQEIIKRVRNRLKADILALSIFEHLREGYTPAEICKFLRVRKNDYEAARSRISRCIKAIL